MAGSDEQQNSRGLRAEINVTPLVDVVLVLLIIFMLVTPLMTRGVPVQLPVSSEIERGTPPAGQIVLTITPDRRLWLETRPIASAALPAALAARTAARPGVELLIKADASLSMRELRPLLSQLKAAGLERIALAVVEPRPTEAVR